MDIVFSHKTQSCYRQFDDPVKRIQVSAESVVPDSQEDIGRIASVRSQVLLKGKEVTSRGISVSGELDTVLLYITEDEKAVSFLRLRKEFSMEVEESDYPIDTLALVRLTVNNTEARVLNPRKVAVVVELQAELSCFCCGEAAVETLLPEEASGLLHAREEKQEAFIINGVCEKTFVLNEQFRFPEGKPVPEQLVAQFVDFQIEDVQQVGSRAVVKGKVSVDVCYLADNAAYPVQTRFNAVFSQIVDTGAEECTAGTVHAELTGAYVDLVDTISGEKAMDAELHAVLQMVSRSRQEIRSITDVYSNRCPLQCSFRELTVSEVSEEQRFRVRGEEELGIAEDCEDVLSVYASVVSFSLSEGYPRLSVGLDVLYRRRSGELSAVRRQMELKGESMPSDVRLYAGRIIGTDLRPQGGILSCRVEAELSGQRFRTREGRAVTGATLREDEPYSTAELPTVTLVRAEGEDLWELAKQYHSSVEAIRQLRDALGKENAPMLLIPRES